MKNFNYHSIMKRLIFISFVLILVNIAYTRADFAADVNGTNTININDSYQV